MLRPENNTIKYTLVFISCLFLGALSANALVTKLDISIHTDRDFFNLEVQQALKPNTEKNIALQAAIYAQRKTYLQHETENLELKKKALVDYILPLESQVIEYRYAFAEKTTQSFSERLALYIDLVRKHSLYNSAQQNKDYVPLADSESLLTYPSIYNDFIRQQGGDLARAHNEFIDEARDSSMAAMYEPKLRQFFAQNKIATYSLECHRQLCAIHLTHDWADPYYQGMTALKDKLAAQPWFNLTDYQSAQEYRGNGRHIGVWYFKGPL